MLKLKKIYFNINKIIKKNRIRIFKHFYVNYFYYFLKIFLFILKLLLIINL